MTLPHPDQDKYYHLAHDGLIIYPFIGYVAKDYEEINLSILEYQLLLYFMTHQGQTLSKEMLMRSMWGDQDYSMAAVWNLIRRLRMKIETDPGNPRHIITVQGHGYLMPADGRKEDDHD